MKLPPEYLNFVKDCEELEFELDLEFGGYIILEPLDDVEKFNQDIEIYSNAPGYLAFGSDGANEVFAFDKESRIFLLPMIGIDPDDAVKIADSWDELISKKLMT